jgi:hypothetical protein
MSFRTASGAREFCFGEVDRVIAGVGYRRIDGRLERRTLSRVQFFGEDGCPEIDLQTFEQLAKLIRKRDGVPEEKEEELETTNAGEDEATPALLRSFRSL